MFIHAYIPKSKPKIRYLMLMVLAVVLIFSATKPLETKATETNVEGEDFSKAVGGGIKAKDNNLVTDGCNETDSQGTVVGQTERSGRTEWSCPRQFLVTGKYIGLWDELCGDGKSAGETGRSR